MLQDRASRTAEFMALFRALESSRRPASSRLFEDSFAPAFLGPGLKAVERAARVPLVGRTLAYVIDHRWPGARSAGIVRTRFIDDALRTALHDGIEQVVILGAGFDCRAHRIAELARTRVLEVDHPATLAVKRARLEQLLATAPAHVRYVAVDFNQDDLAHELSRAEFNARQRSFFIWEGVTNYLSAEAVDGTLRCISRLSEPGSRLAFTYVHLGVIDGSTRFFGTERLFATLRKNGEPWTFGLEPSSVGEYLEERHFALIEDVGIANLRERYWGPSGSPREARRPLTRPSAARAGGYEFYRVALARIEAGP